MASVSSLSFRKIVKELLLEQNERSWRSGLLPREKRGELIYHSILLATVEFFIFIFFFNKRMTKSPFFSH